MEALLYNRKKSAVSYNILSFLHSNTSAVDNNSCIEAECNSNTEVGNSSNTVVDNSSTVVDSNNTEVLVYKLELLYNRNLLVCNSICKAE